MCEFGQLTVHPCKEPAEWVVRDPLMFYLCTRHKNLMRLSFAAHPHVPWEMR